MKSGGMSDLTTTDTPPYVDPRHITYSKETNGLFAFRCEIDRSLFPISDRFLSLNRGEKTHELNEWRDEHRFCAVPKCGKHNSNTCKECERTT